MKNFYIIYLQNNKKEHLVITNCKNSIHAKDTFNEKKKSNMHFFSAMPAPKKAVGQRIKAN